MSKQVQIRRGTAAEIDAFTGADGELTVDTDKKTIVVHDGSTQGGTPLAKEDLSNSLITDCNGLTINGFYYFSAGVLNGPKEGRDGRLLHIEQSDRMWSQIAITSGKEFWFRDNDTNNMPTPWVQVADKRDVTTAKIIEKVASATGDDRLPRQRNSRPAHWRNWRRAYIRTGKGSDCRLGRAG